jgi:apolipoprotein N-acyltransferase
VPFGEYLPFSGLLESWGLRQFVQIPGGFDAGASRRLLTAPGLPGIAPLVCYEAVFPGAVSSALRGSAGLMLNVSNDGWFGETAGPHQHLAQARLRSIEEGLPMLRAANTGISAAIDPYGRILKSLPLGAAGVIDTPLMKPADPPLAARYPVGAPAALFGLFLVIAAALRVQR